MKAFEPAQQISVALSAQDWNTVIAALGEIPHRVAAPLINTIVAQARKQHEQDNSVELVDDLEAD